MLKDADNNSIIILIILKRDICRDDSCLDII